ncbi:MAG: hypothetical protein ABIK15_20125 [Pseudomonadota bacterium]
MPTMMADLHVHSKCSRRPSYWILQKLGAAESYIRPENIYQTAKEKGMTFVTITDHNSIEGCLEIAHMPGVFISEEVTTYFPDSGCKIHILALNITEAQHAEIQKLRADIFDLAAYLNAESITGVVAHPLYAINGRLTPAHFEKLLLLFHNFEMNGSRDDYRNAILLDILSGLDAEQMDRLADYHNIIPFGSAYWKKGITGGSDDHTGRHIASTYTMVQGKGSVEDFISGINAGKSLVRGRAGSPGMLAQRVYSSRKAETFKRRFMPCETSI